MPGATGLYFIERECGSGRIEALEGAKHILERLVDGDVYARQTMAVIRYHRVVEDEREVHGDGLQPGEGVGVDVGHPGLIRAAGYMGGGEEGATEIMGPGFDVIEVAVGRHQPVRERQSVGHHAKQATIVIEGVEVDDLGVGEGILVGDEYRVG